MKIIRTGEPPILPVVERHYWGIHDGLVVMVLSCGHDYCGLVKDGWAAHTAYPCTRCVLEIVPDNWKAGDVRQLPLFAA